VSYAVRRPCSDFMDMLRRLINCRIIIIIIIVIIIIIIVVKLLKLHAAKRNRFHWCL